MRHHHPRLPLRNRNTSHRYSPPLLLQLPADAGPLTQLLAACSLPKDRGAQSLLPPSSPALYSACAAALASHSSLATYISVTHPSLLIGGGGSSELQQFSRDCKQLVKDIAAADKSVTNAIR